MPPTRLPEEQIRHIEQTVMAYIDNNLSISNTALRALTGIKYDQATYFFNRMPHFGLRGICEADRAAIRALLRGQPPPGIIFSPGRRPPVLMRLQTADHRRRASPVQEEQGAAAPCDWARIMRFPVCEQVDTVALSFAH